MEENLDVFDFSLTDDELGADVFEIVPQRVYSKDDLNWTDSQIMGWLFQD